MRDTITKILQVVDTWLQQLVDEAHAHGDTQAIPPLQLKIVGQMALLIADLPFPIAATMDIDILHTLPHFAAKKLGELFLDSGLVLESDQHLIWMPEHTIYHPLFDGAYIHATVADPFYVIASKCKFKRAKDKPLIQIYCQDFPDALQKIAAMTIDTAWVKS